LNRPAAPVGAGGRHGQCCTHDNRRQSACRRLAAGGCHSTSSSAAGFWPRAIRSSSLPHHSFHQVVIVVRTHKQTRSLTRQTHTRNTHTPACSCLRAAAFAPATAEQTRQGTQTQDGRGFSLPTEFSSVPDGPPRELRWMGPHCVTRPRPIRGRGPHWHGARAMDEKETIAGGNLSVRFLGTCHSRAGRPPAGRRMALDSGGDSRE
jgi:hypothetical protein